MFELARKKVAGFWENHSAFAVTAGSGLVTPLVAFIASPVLTRLYSPIEFGVLGTFTALLAAALSVANLRFEVAIPLPEKDEEAFALAAASIKIAFGTTAISTLFLIISGPYLFEKATIEALASCIWWFPLALFFASVTQVLTFFLVRRGAFGQLASARVAQGIIGPSVQIVAGSVGFGIAGLLIGQAASQIGGLTRLFSYFKKCGKVLGPIPSGKPLLKRYIRFPKISLFSAFVNALGMQLPIIFVSQTHGMKAAGLIALIFRVIGGPISIFTSAATQLTFSEGAALRRKGADSLKLIKHTLRRQFLVTLPVLIVTPFMPVMFPLIFGGRWGEAGKYSLAIVPSIVVMNIMSPTHAILDIYERQDLQLVREIVRVVSLFGAVMAAKACGGTLWSIVIALSLALAGNSFFGYLMAINLVKRRGDVSPSQKLPNETYTK